MCARLTKAFVSTLVHFRNKGFSDIFPLRLVLKVVAFGSTVVVANVSRTTTAYVYSVLFRFVAV